MWVLLGRFIEYLNIDWRRSFQTEVIFKKNVRATLFLELYLFLQHLHFKIVFILKNVILIVNISTLFLILFLKF